MEPLEPSLKMEPLEPSLFIVQGWWEKQMTHLAFKNDETVFSMGHINNLICFYHFWKKLVYPLWMQKYWWCSFSRRRQYVSETWCSSLPSVLPLSGHHVLAPSLRYLPCALNLELGSVAARANEQPAKHLCPSLRKEHTGWCFISIDSLCISIAYHNIIESQQKQCKKWMLPFLSQSEWWRGGRGRTKGLSMVDGKCARNRLFLGYLK